MRWTDYATTRQRTAAGQAFLARDAARYAARHPESRYDRQNALARQESARVEALQARLAVLGLCWEERWKLTDSLDGTLLAPPDIW